MSTKHTSGPWICDMAQTGIVVHILASPGHNGLPVRATEDADHRCCIAGVYARDRIEAHGRTVGTRANPEGMANLRLIAAAPDLLSACRAALAFAAAHKAEWIGVSMTAEEYEIAMRPLAAAIAGAEGVLHHS